MKVFAWGTGWKTGLGGGEQTEVMSAYFRQREQPVGGGVPGGIVCPGAIHPKGSGARVSVLAQLLSHVTLDKLFPTVGWSLHPQQKSSMCGK